jgi:2-amino-4-hydroxy-6-hydroxymethyldihydropteridine diphosphokinase
MVQVAIILGANQSDPERVVSAAIRLIEGNVGAVIKFSKKYKTQPWGYESVNPYLNMVLIVESDLDNFKLMETLLRIEKILGRKRVQQSGYSDRMIDLDVLYIDSQVIDTEVLQVPHPRLHLRIFCLLPLMDVNPQWIHPILNKDINQMLSHCEDEGEITIWEDN